MRYWWYGNQVGGFSNITGITPESEHYKYIGNFTKEHFINKNMYILKCTDRELMQKEFQNPFNVGKVVFTKDDILKLYESMDEMDEIIITR